MSNNRNTAIIRVALLHDDCEILNGFFDDRTCVLEEQRGAIDTDTVCFSYTTEKRCYIVAQSSGHTSQYSRSWILAASIADVAVVQLDAHNGLHSRARFNCYFAAILGIRHIVLVVNDIDKIDANANQYEAVVSEFRTFVEGLGFAAIHIMPRSRLQKSDCTNTSRNVHFDLLDELDTLDSFDSRQRGPLYMQICHQNQQNGSNHRLYGRMIAGTLQTGNTVTLFPENMQTQVEVLFNDHCETAEAHAGESISFELHDHVETHCGDVLAAADHTLEIADQFEANLVWFDDQALVPGRRYQMALSSKEVNATVTGIKYHADAESGAHLATRKLKSGEVGRVTLYTHEPLTFEHNGRLRELNGFLLIDKLSGELAGAGMIDFALRRATNIKWQALAIDKASRALQKKQTPKCVWFTGLSGSGKSTIANQLEKQLHQNGYHTYLLDGDNVRHGLCRDLGFTEADRVENIRRVSEVAKLMVDAGLIVLVSFISPFRSERRLARELFGAGEFVEVFVDTNLEECERRDVKGLYAKARDGILKNFTGIDSPYEPPETPEIHIQTSSMTPQLAVEHILKQLDTINH